MVLLTENLMDFPMAFLQMANPMVYPMVSLPMDCLMVTQMDFQRALRRDYLKVYLRLELRTAYLLMDFPMVSLMVNRSAYPPRVILTVLYLVSLLMDFRSEFQKANQTECPHSANHLAWLKDCLTEFLLRVSRMDYHSV